MHFKILPVGTQDTFLSGQTEKQLLCKLSNSIKKSENQNRDDPLKCVCVEGGIWHCLLASIMIHSFQHTKLKEI